MCVYSRWKRLQQLRPIISSVLVFHRISEIVVTYDGKQFLRGDRSRSCKREQTHAKIE